MLWMITVLLLVLWLLGMVSGYTLGAWIHVLLILAVVSVILAIIRRGAGEAV
jgi:uncharacterized protein DUF5670